MCRLESVHAAVELSFDGVYCAGTAVRNYTGHNWLARGGKRLGACVVCCKFVCLHPLAKQAKLKWRDRPGMLNSKQPLGCHIVATRPIT